MDKSSVQPNILLVDDKEDGLMAMEVALRDLRYPLYKARSGKEALSLLLNHEFAVILLDVQMPEMNGFETATFIKKRDKTKNIPIIFVSGLEKDERFVSYGYESGAVDYIFKPFDAKILQSKVSVFVELIEQGRQIKAQADQIAEIQRQEQIRKLERLEIESRMRYRNLADAIPHIVWKASADLTVDYFNRTWVEHTGLGHEESSGSGWQAAFHQDDLAKFLQRWREAGVAAEDFEIEARVYNRKREEFRWHLVKVVADKFQKEEVSSWLLSFTEIHTLKEYEARLIEAKREADSANRAKSFFLANMSHEIRTPLGAIMGFSDLLLQGETTPHVVTDYAQTIHKNSEQLLKIIDEILDISKVESGSLQIAHEKIDLSDLMTSVESYLQIQARKKGIDIAFLIDGLVPQYFYSDPTRVRQILTNIVGNAVKFSSQGKVTVTINASESDDGMKIFFRVDDTGPGIDEQYMYSIFKPFSQGDSSTSRKFGGTGLGLALSRKLARALGGDVELTSSQKDVGSVFTITLTSHTGSDVPMIRALSGKSGPKAGAPIEAKKVSQDGLKGIRILLADDAVENQRLITWYLEKAGAFVELAQDGEEAVQKAMGGTHHIVLMDIQMPGIDGYQATQILRNRGYEKPIIAVTAHALLEERERCLQAGCTDHFSKPIDGARLIEKVMQYSL